jgi:magnesium transporter
MSDKKQEPDLIEQIGDAVDSAAESIGDFISGLAMPKPRKVDPGSAPGLHKQDLEKMEDAGDVTVEAIDYCNDKSHRQIVDDLDHFLADHRPRDTKVRWINVNGLSNASIIRKLEDKYHMHPLAVEDVFNVPQRAKVDAYQGDDENFAWLYIVAHMIQPKGDRVRSEQVSIFLGKGTVLTFLEDPGDVFDPVRARIEQEGSRLRQHDEGYLVYAMLDAIVDHCFPILEQYSDRLESIEEQVMKGAKPEIVNDIYRIKRDLLLLGKQIWPLREMISALMREDHETLSDSTRLYMRDVYDHAIQLMEMLEAYRELAGGLADTHLTVVGNRMNEVMKVLTIFATIFIPITFIAGVYGMNFDVIPELKWEYSYAVFWGLCLSVAGGMLLWFKRRGWL